MSLAAHGVRNMDNGVEKINDDAIVRQVRKQARKVNIESALLAVALTLLFLFL